MSRSQGEELHQGGRLPKPPGILGNGSRIYTSPKPTEQPYPCGLAFLASRNLGPPHTLTSRRIHPPPSHLRFASALFHLQNALCRWRHAVHLTAFVGASIHVHRLPPDLRLPFRVSGLGLPLCSCERSAQILTAGSRLGRVGPHRRWPTKDQRCPRNTMPPASENW